MKLNYFQLMPHLNKQLLPIYIVCGDDIILKNEAQTLIRKKAKQAGFNERIRLQQETDLDEERLYAELYANSLMQEKKLLEFDFREALPSKTIANILAEYGKQPAPENTVLVDLNKLDNKVSKSAWFQALSANGAVVTIWPLQHEQLLQWITQRTQRYKLNLKADALHLLAERTEGNLVATAQCIEKIYLLNTHAPIDTDTINAVLTDESRFTIFDLVEHLIAQNINRSLHILQVLKNEGTEPVLILWGITRELRLLAEFASALKAGVSLSSLFQKYRIYAQRQHTIRHFLAQFTLKECWQYLAQAQVIDKIIKGAAPGNPWHALERWCCDFQGQPIIAKVL